MEFNFEIEVQGCRNNGSFDSKSLQRRVLTCLFNRAKAEWLMNHGKPSLIFGAPQKYVQSEAYLATELNILMHKEVLKRWNKFLSINASLVSITTPRGARRMSPGAQQQELTVSGKVLKGR